LQQQKPVLRSQVHGLIRSCPHQALPIAGRASPCGHWLRRHRAPCPPCCRWAQPVARCRWALHAPGRAPRGCRAQRARRCRCAPQGRRCRWAPLLRRRQRMQRPARLRASPLRCAVLQACARACTRSPRLHTPQDQASSGQYEELRSHICAPSSNMLACAQRQKHAQLAAARGAHSVCVAASAGPAAAPASAPAGACRAPASAAGAAAPSLALPLRGMSDRYATSTPLRAAPSAHPSAGVAYSTDICLGKRSRSSCCAPHKCSDLMQRPHTQAQQASASV